MAESEIAGQRAAIDSARLRRVAMAMAEWRASLINVDANNRLLYYKDLKTGTLGLAAANPSGVEQLRRGQTVRLGRLFSDPEELTRAQKAVRQIAGKARAAEEEFGVPIAFLAIGMATWDDGRSSPAAKGTSRLSADDESKPVRRTPTPAAPVLLQALEFEARPGTPDGFEITSNGDVFVNPVLIHVLTSQFGAVVDEAELLEAAGDDSMLFSLLEKTCKEVPQFAITERILIGTFSYMKQPMVDDLGEDQLKFLADNDLVAAIAGVAEAREAIRSTGGEVSETSPDYEPPANEFLVLDADASQSYVINAASNGQHLVVQGPPGTGKSQTIANLIADLIAHGKSVLFVAQKRAAITAVLHRLESVGLGGLTLDMFEGAGSRKSVVGNLGASLEEKASARTVDVEALHFRWTSARDHLTSHQTALHEKRTPWNVSLWDVIGMERGLPVEAHTDVRLPAATLSQWTPTSIDQLASAAGELAASRGFDPVLAQRSGWGIDAFETLEQLNASHQLAVDALSTALPRVEAAFGAVAVKCAIPSPNSLGVAANILALYLDTSEAFSAGLGAVLDPQLENPTLGGTIAATAPKEWRTTHGVTVSWGERRAGKKAARALLEGSSRAGSPHETLEHCRILRGKWEVLGAAMVPSPDTATFAEASVALLNLQELLRQLEPVVQGPSLTGLQFANLAEALTSLVNDPDRARLPQIHHLRSQIRAGGLDVLLLELGQLNPDVATAQGKVRYAFAMSVAGQVLNTDSRLAGVTREQLELWASEFLAADVEHLKANAARVRRLAAERMASVLNEHPDQHSEIKRQVRRKRGFSSVRRLFQEAPDILAAIKPCWAMSPLMVSQMLPATELFDVVIFDEASQVMPADAIPAISRGKQLVVAGDRHQLPPTDFFAKLSVPGDIDLDFDEEDEDIDDDAELTVAVPETRDVESILDTLDVVLAGRSRTLTWHYRSKDEKLIATSNAYVYHHQMITFPGSDSSDRIQFEAVELSAGLGVHNKSPVAEVARVIDLAIEHAATRPEESLGVIAIGSDHAKRIEAALDARLQSEPELRGFFQQSGAEPFFIKNIERVQGDEREAIILTVGYGKADDGRMRYIWGPLLTQGGERRLNVAISRARSSMTLVSSFEADDVDPDANHSAGFDLMYRFLQFMSSSGTSFGGDPGRDYELNPFEADVMYRLNQAGLDLEPQWGVGNYRIDFAVRHPDKPGRFVLALECDGAMYHSGIVARERDRLRQQHLERLGWRFHRIWSTDWWTDPQPQIDAVLESYKAALEVQRPMTVPEVTNIYPSASEAVPSVEAPPAGAVSVRTAARPPIYPGEQIGVYSDHQLTQLIHWIKSDDVVRTDDELFEEAVKALGYKRRGARIVERLTLAIARANGS